MRLSDEQLLRLVVSDPSDPDVLAELRERTRWTAIKAMPRRVGTLNGRPVYTDDKGAYSSGLTCYERGGPINYDHYDRIVWDPAVEAVRERYRRIAESLR